MLKPYPAYKSTNLPWLPQIPADANIRVHSRNSLININDQRMSRIDANGWQLQKLKTLVRLRNERQIGCADNYVGMENVESWTGCYIKTDNYEADSTCNVFRKGDLLFGKLRPYLAKTWIAEFDGAGSTEFLVLHDCKANVKYLYYLFLTKPFVDYVDSSTYGAKMPRTSWDFIGNCKIPLPPRAEQDAIVRFLDAKTAQIDALIAAKRQLADLLRERKQALINESINEHRITRIDTNEWTSARLKDCAVICNGSDYSGVKVEEGGFPVMGSGGEFARASKFTYDKPSVLFGRKGTIDKPLYIDEPFWAVDTMFYTKIKNTILPKFLYYCATQFDYNRYATKTALPSMTQSDLGTIKLSVPPLETQRRIVAALDGQCAIIDDAIRAYSRYSILLSEYKTRLIADVVTGAADVYNKRKEAY